jgi:chromatin remodeling complex protein RSC6
MSMRLAMKASLESAALDEKAKQKELRKAKKEAKRARKAELAAAAEAAAPAAEPAAAPAAPPAPAADPEPPAAAPAPDAAPPPAPMDTSPPAPPPPEPAAPAPPAPPEPSAPEPAPEPAAPAPDAAPAPEAPEAPAAPAPEAPEPEAPAEAPTLRARIATHLDALLKEVDLDEMNMKSLRKKVASDLNIEIAGEDKDWFKEHVTKRVQARAEPDEEDEDPRHPLISEDMSAVVGVSRANHFRLVKLLWKYIKAHNLQNPANRNEILCDEKLKKVFKRDKVTGFGMSKLLGQHIFKDGEATKPKAPKKKKKQREPSDDEESDEQPKKKKKKAYPKPATQYKGSAALAAFAGVETNNRFTLSKIFWAHIKANNLQSDPSNKRIIVCDDKLKALFGVERFEMFQLAKHIKKHFEGGEEE